MGTRSISLRTDEETLKKIDELAAHEDRSRNWWINQAVQNALDEEGAWQDEIARRLAEADAGNFATDEEVEVVFAEFRGPKD